jgi:hypothetical protein
MRRPDLEFDAATKARFIAQYTDPNLSVKDLMRIWGYPSGTLYRKAFELELKRPKHKGEIQITLAQARQYCEQVSRELPPYTFDATKVVPVGMGRVMELILFLCDLHAGRLTKSFDAEVLGNRLEALAERLMSRVKLLQHSYMITKLHLFLLGDCVVGEQVGRNVTLEELEHMVLSQVYNICIPQLVRFTNRILLVPIKVHAVRGNHGLAQKYGASKAANWDTVVYLGWQARMQDRREVTFNIATTQWYNYAVVRKLTWLLVHGDQFSVGGGTPYNGIKTKVDRWHQSMPLPFDYVAAGHLHHFAQIAETWLSGTLLTDDDWSREVLGKAGDCGQLLLGVTDDGIEYASPIWLEDVGHSDD